MAKIYFSHLFPTGVGTDQEAIDTIISRVKASGLPNVRVMTWETTFNVVPRLENVVTQLSEAGFGVDVLYSLDNKKISEARMRELCTITRGETIFIHPGGGWGEWGTPVDWLKTFNDVARTFGHTFGYVGGGEGLAYIEPLTMLKDTGIITETYFNPAILPPRQAYVEPYSHNWRLRWIYPNCSAQFLKAGYGRTSPEIIKVVDDIKAFLKADGTMNSLKKVVVVFSGGESYVKPEQAEGIAYLLSELGVPAPPPVECIPIVIGGLIPILFVLTVVSASEL